MAIGQIIKQKSFDGVTAGGRASTRIPAQGLHYGLYMVPRASGGAALTVAQACASLGSVQILVNGDLKVNAKVSELLMLHYNRFGCFPGSDPVDTFATQYASPCAIPWNWVNEIVDTFRERLALALGCKDVSSYEVTIDVVNPTGSTACTSIDCFTDSDPDVNLPMGTHRTLLSYQRNFASTGLREEKDIPFSDRTGAMTAVYWTQYGITGTLGTLSSLLCKVNNRLVQDTVAPEVLLAANNGRRYTQPKTNILDVQTSVAKHIILAQLRFDGGGSNVNFLDFSAVSDLRFTENWSVTPNAFNILVEGVRNLSRG